MTAIAPAFAAAFAASAAATRALAAFAAVALDASAAADSSTDNLRRGNFLPVLISLRRVNFSAIMSAMAGGELMSHMLGIFAADYRLVHGAHGQVAGPSDDGLGLKVRFSWQTRIDHYSLAELSRTRTTLAGSCQGLPDC